MPELEFLKMHGTGNDFILFDTRKRPLPHPSKLAGKLCDRRFGIGADQMLLLEPSSRGDFRMRIFNPDGSEVEQCGNGIRCLARYVWTRGLSRKSLLPVETGGGVVLARKRGHLVQVDMGEPVLDGPRIPANLAGRILSRPLTVDGREFRITCVSMGNPHCVIFHEEDGATLARTFGPALERHPFFPKRTNVEFVKVETPKRLRVDVWERGAGVTLSCGTGACASLVAAALGKRTERTCEVRLPGGSLNIRWDVKTNHVFMTGPAEEVFAGRVKV